MTISKLFLFALFCLISSLAYAVDGGGVAIGMGGVLGIIELIVYGLIFVIAFSLICLGLAFIFYFQSKLNPTVTIFTLSQHKTVLASFLYFFIFIGMLLACLFSIFFLPDFFLNSMWSEILFVPLGIISTIFWIASYIFTVSQLDKKSI